MAIVDVQYVFMWASCGYPGNSHDAIISKHDFLPKNRRKFHHSSNKSKRKWCQVKLLVLGDSAFPFSIWLMKPYRFAGLSKEEGYFNYRQSRARMLVDGGYVWSVE